MPKRRRAPTGESMKVSFRASVKFERMLRIFRDTYQASPRPEALTVAYVVMCAAALEAILNDALLEHAADKWGQDQKDYGNALLTMTFRSKLDTLPVLLTSHKFRFDKQYWVYQRLAALISERNNVVHPKPKEHDFPIARMPHPVFGGTPNFPVFPAEYYSAIDDLTMGAGSKYTPLEYHEALEKLDKWFLRRLPDGISRIAMLVPNAKD